jgi:CubicO group peptidase (beta-lactamase class C family)
MQGKPEARAATFFGFLLGPGTAFLVSLATPALLAAAYSVPWLRWLPWVAFVPLILAARGQGRLHVYFLCAASILLYCGYVFGVSDLWRMNVWALIASLVLVLIVLAAEFQLLGARLGKSGWLAPPLLFTLFAVAVRLLLPPIAEEAFRVLSIPPVSGPILALASGTWAGYAILFLVLLANFGLAEAQGRLPALYGRALIIPAFLAAGAFALIGGPIAELPSSRPEAQGMDAKTLAEMDGAIRTSLRQIRSVVVVRHGSIVFERYYNGTNPESYNLICSATKSFTGALVGIALGEGFLRSPEQKVLDFFPEYASPGLDPRVRDISLRHLLTMSSGFRWNELSSMGEFFRIKGQADWIRPTLELPLSDPPGARFNYNSFGVHLLSAVVNRAARTSRMEFADRRLFGRLGIYRRIWLADPKGNSFGGADLFLRARDMAKFGQLYLQGGSWKGEPIVPADWVAESTRAHNAGGPPHGEAYGECFWVTKAGGYEAYFAGGFGGQFIYVVPGLDLVAAIASMTDRHHEENRSIVPRYLIPSIVKP